MVEKSGKIFTCLLFFYTILFAQTYKNIINSFTGLSLQKQCDTIASIGWKNRNENPILGIELCNYSINLAKKNGLENLLPKYYNYIGIIYRNINNLIEAETNFIKAIKLSEKYNNQLELAYAHNNIGNIFIIKYDTLNGFRYLEKAKKLFFEIKNHLGISYVYQRYGQAYLNYSNYYLSYQNYNQAYQYRLKTKDTFAILSSLKPIIYCLCKLKDKKNVKLYLAEFDKYSNYINNNPFQLNEMNLYKAIFYQSENEFDKSIEYALPVLDFFIKLNNFANIRLALEILSENYKQKNDYKNQAKYLEMLKIYNEKYQKSINNNYLTHQIYKYEYEKHQEIIEKNTFYLKIILITVSISLIIITYLLFRNIKKRNILKESNKKLEELNNYVLEQYNDINQVRKDLEKSKELLEQLIITLAHDLKNPINAIISFTELSLDELNELPLPKDNKLSKNLSFINSAGNSLYHLIENVLYWSRSLTNRLIYEPVYFNLYDILDSIILSLSLQLKLKNIEIQVNVKQNQEIFGDPQLLTVVFRNIISNSIKYTNNNGLITINYDFDGLFNNITFIDNGIGMSEDRIKLILDNNSNYNSITGTNNESGTGFGYFLIKNFVEMHQGTITIKSTLGQGTKVTISLPAHY